MSLTVSFLMYEIGNVHGKLLKSSEEEEEDGMTKKGEMQDKLHGVDCD